MSSIQKIIKEKFRKFVLGNKVKKVLKKTGLFEHLNRKEFKKLYQAAKKVSFSSGELILKEGEIGDSFFLLEKGEVCVFSINAEGEEIPLSCLKEGSFFGEQALVDESLGRRNASIKALSDVELLKIFYSDVHPSLYENQQLKKILKTIGHEQLIKKILTKSPLFQSIPENLFNQLTGRVYQYPDKHVIFSQGDEAHHVYFIMSGEVKIYLKYEKETADVVVKIGQEQLFGELGVLKGITREGTAITCGETELLVVEGKIFYDVYWANPRLQTWVEAMQRMYAIPRRGIVSSAAKSKFLDLDAIKTTYDFDNRQIIALQALGKNIFTMMEVKEIKLPQVLRYEEPSGITREIILADDKLIGITSIGIWEQLSHACSLLLDNKAIKPLEIKLFQKTGNFVHEKAVNNFNDDEIFCYCMRIKVGTIKNVIRTGLKELEEVSKVTGAGTVCGACRYKINEFLGKAEWTLVYIDKVIPLTPSIHLYRLKPHQNKILSYQPGQIVIIQALIEDHWVERYYSLISVPDHDEYYEIVVKEEPHGYFSHWLFLNEAEEPLIRVSKPQGNFTIDVRSNSPIVFFAGGIGVAPAVAFARSLDVKNYQGKFHIDYSADTEKELIFSDEFLTIEKSHPNFSVHFRKTDEDGILTEDKVAKILAEFPGAKFYVCGHKRYQMAIETLLKSQGITQERIHIETFLHAGSLS
ncbi:MAG: cyclic nucleotide-binding domain-containing protein [Gammaproteobacteria bacterium]